MRLEGCLASGTTAEWSQSSVRRQRFGRFPFGKYRRFPIDEEAARLDSDKSAAKRQMFYTSDKWCEALRRIVSQRLPPNSLLKRGLMFPNPSGRVLQCDEVIYGTTTSSIATKSSPLKIIWLSGAFAIPNCNAGKAWHVPAEGDMKTTYRGYTVFYYSAGGWLGFVYPPGAVKATGETEEATKGEGEEVLLDRVKARIDAEMRPKKKTSAIGA